MINYKGKNVLITGSSMGIGKGLSLCFAREGAHLALADLPTEKDRLEGWAAELRKDYGITVWTFYGDLTEQGGPERLHAEVTSTVGAIHTLVNNAGISWYGQFKDMPLARIERMLLLNCTAYTILSRLFLPSMIAKDEGAIWNVSSGTAFQPCPTMAVYAASKAYVQSFTDALRGELPRGSKIVVAILNPPFVWTPLIEDSGFPLDYIPILMTIVHVPELTEPGYKAFKKGKHRYIPGVLNQILFFGIIKYLPHGGINRVSWLLTHRLSDFLPESVVAAIVKLRSK